MAEEVVSQEPLRRDRPILNSRPVAFCAATLAVGVIFGALFREVPIVSYVLIAVGILGATALICLRKNIFAGMLIFAVIGLCSFTVTYAFVSLNNAEYDAAYVSGVVAEVKSDVSATKTYVIDDVQINGKDVDGKAVVYAESEHEVGDEIGVYGSGSTFEYDPFDSYSANYYYYDIRHKFNADFALSVGEGNVSVFSKLRAHIGKVYVANMGERAGGLALGLVTGDKSGIDEDVTQAMRDSGLSHLTAVSGLHVGFMCAIIYFIFRLFRRSKRSSLFVVTVVLLFYGALTGFPPGVVRASIMAIVMLTAMYIGERYDPLNALALSVIIILVFNPRELFSLSFLMSVSAVLGILCFYRQLRKYIYKGRNKALRWIVDAAALSISANVYLVAVSACAFGTFSTYFLIANPLAVAYSSLVYSLLVPVTLFALIPHLGFLLVPFKYLMLGLYGFASAIAGLPGAVMNIGSNVVSAMCYALGMFACSGYFRVEKRVKVVILCAFSALSLILLYAI